MASFPTDRKFKALVEGEFSTQRKTAAGVPQGSDIPPILYSQYKNDAPRHLELILLCLKGF
jgi:hypothetical protein